MLNAAASDGPFSIAFLSCISSSSEDGSLEESTTASPPFGGSRRTVMVVDDEELIADSIAEILNRNGYEATAKYSGKDAIRHLNEECPDIVVSDVILPKFNGIQLAIAVRSRCHETRILLFSGNTATLDLLANASRQGQSFELLAKPIHPEELLKALKASPV